MVNVTGEGATAGPAEVARSPADGYTLLLNTSAHAYSAALARNIAYDPLKDFVPVAALTTQPYVLLTGKSAGFATLHELIAAAKHARASSRSDQPESAPARTSVPWRSTGWRASMRGTCLRRRIHPSRHACEHGEWAHDLSALADLNCASRRARWQSRSARCHDDASLDADAAGVADR